MNDQDQHVSDNAIAIQAKGSVTIHKTGLDLTEVKELTEIFLERHLPALREEAAAIAKKNASDFMNEFVKKMAQPNTVKGDAFAKPDSQACFSEALRSSAEKGDQIDLEFLASLVVRRLEADSDPLMKLVYEEAISVLPKLTNPQIAFLVFIHFTKHLTLKNPSAFSLERNAATILPLVNPGFGLSTANKEYLCSKGVMSINLVADADLLRQNYQQMAADLPDDDATLKEKYSNLHSVIVNYGANNLPTCFLTATGKLIALSAMERAYGKLDMTIWIN